MLDSRAVSGMICYWGTEMSEYDNFSTEYHHYESRLLNEKTFVYTPSLIFVN